MNSGKIYIGKLKLGVKRLQLNGHFQKIEAFYQKLKVKRRYIFSLAHRDRVPKSEHVRRDSFVRTIFDIFGFTAVMSIPVLFCMVVLALSFVMHSFLAFLSEYGWLLFGLSLLTLGIGWVKPYKVWSHLLVVCGAFLFVLPFSPQLMEWYTGNDVLNLYWKNGFLSTLKASLMLLCYVIGSTLLLAWVYLVSKGQRQNPFRRFRIVRIKQGLKQLKKLYTN